MEFINSVMRQQDQGHGRQLRYRPELVADLTDDTGKLAQGGPRTASRRRHGAVRRDLLRLHEKSCSRISRATNSAAPW